MSLELGYLTEMEMALLSKKTGLTLEEIKAAQEVYSNTQISSLDAPIKQTGDSFEDTTLLDFIEDKKPTPEEEIFQKDRSEHLIKIIGEVLTKPREYRVIMLRFGFETGSIMTLEEIGKIYNVSRERIRQVEAKALGRLRQRFKKEGKYNWLY